MAFSLTLSQRALILVAIPLTFEVTLMVTLTQLLRNAELEAERQSISKEIVATVDTTQIHFYRCLHNLVSFYSSRNQKFRKEFGKERKLFESELSQLESMLTSDAVRKEEIITVQKARRAVLEQFDRIIKHVENPSEDSAFSLITGLDLNKDLQSIINKFVDEMAAIAAKERDQYTIDTEGEQQSRQKVFEVITWGLAGNILLAGLLIFHFNRTTTRRFRILTENSIRLAAGRPLNPSMAESDELGELDRRFHQMASTLTEASQRERAVLDNATDVICSIDENLNFLEVNPAVESVWGYSPADIVGRRLISLFDEVLRDEMSESMQRCRANNEEIRIETRLKRRDTTIIDLVWSARWSQREKAFFCVAHDISERKAAEDKVKESESRIRSLIDNMPVGLITVNQKAQIQSANPSAEIMTAHAKGELVGKPLTYLLPNLGKGGSNDAELQSIKELTSEKPLITEIQRKGGDFVPVEISLASFGLGREQLSLVMVVDITERIKADQLKRDFVAMVSHDLKTPLNSVRGFLQLAAMGTYGQLDEQGEQRLELAERNLERLLAMVRDLLDIEKLESGMMELNMQDMSTAELINAAADSVRDYAEHESITLIVSAEDTRFLADQERLIQVLVNLLSNAIKFSPAGATVELKGSILGANYEIRVTDNGTGIPAKYRATIFERFKQVGDRAAKRRGSGLGLAISKAIVEQHQGTIGMESTIGEGSSFWVKLPIARVFEDDAYC